MADSAHVTSRDPAAELLNMHRMKNASIGMDANASYAMHLSVISLGEIHICRMRDESGSIDEQRARQPRSVGDKLWEAEARRILKAELARQGLTYKALVSRLQAIGVKDDDRAISNRISRGKFQFTFFLQCMRAIGVVEVDLRDRSQR